MRFSIFQLFVLLTIAAVATLYLADRWIVKYPYKSTAETTSVNLHGGWRFREFIGDTDGPFRRIGASQFNNKSPTTLRLAHNGSLRKHPIPREYGDGEFKVEYFENIAGNTLCVLFDRSDD